MVKFTTHQNLEPLKLSKMAVFEFLNSLKLFSRKICVAEKLLNCHTVVEKKIAENCQKLPFQDICQKLREIISGSCAKMPQQLCFNH